MYLARVTGVVVASTRPEGLKGTKLLIVEPCDAAGNKTGEAHVAADQGQAGVGDLVSCVGSREASLALSPSFVPVDAAVVGIVDRA